MSAFSVRLSLSCLLASFSLNPYTHSALVAITVLIFSQDSSAALASWSHFSRSKSVFFNNLSSNLESHVPQTILSLIRKSLMSPKLPLDAKVLSSIM